MKHSFKVGIGTYKRIVIAPTALEALSASLKEYELLAKEDDAAVVGVHEVREIHVSRSEFPLLEAQR